MSVPVLRSDCVDRSVNDFWKSVSDSRIDRICEVPAPPQYSGAAIPRIEALEEEAKVLQDALRTIQLRCTNERHALNAVLRSLRKRQTAAEREIAQSIATVHHHHNTLIPMARLPPEILAQILVLHAQTESPDWHLNAAATSTRVCQRWRQVALGCPELWSYIRCVSCRSVGWMKTMMERSCTVPLSFEVGAGPETDIMVLVIKNLHRCKWLSLHPSSYMSHDPYPFFENFIQRAPLLRRLEMEGSQGRFAFPPNFLRGRAPNLRHIKLSACSGIPWHSALFTNLVSLEVDGALVEVNTPDESSVEMLLYALARMPTLELLFLHNCFPHPTPSTKIATHVYLPNLQLFHVTGALEDCTRFLRQITVNATAVVRVDIRGFDAPRADIEEFFVVFPSHLCATFPPITQALQFTQRDGDELEVDARTVQQGTALKSSFHVSFKWKVTPPRGTNLLDLVWTCFAALASHQLQSFRILGGGIEGWDVRVWNKIARMAPDLQRLSPGRGALSAELCKALCPPDGPDLAPADCCFPALSYLELAAPYGFPMLAPGGRETLLAVMLAHSLAARSSIGCSTPELVFLVDCGRFPESWPESFRDAVPGVIIREGHGQGEPVMVSGIKKPQLWWE
ncbi:hypothetical protein BD779DRAFT_1681281 [Infundibulicybe gibba]|nr:hypothetical protein BD779DRAFT_1681281 [Infundibulicybe gibba]